MGSVAGARARLLESMGHSDAAAEAYERAVSAELAIGSPRAAAASQEHLDHLRASQPRPVRLGP